MDSVSNILGIDKVNMSGKLILIEEQHDSNANFLLNSVIFNALKNNYGICFVLFHNTMNHYHNMGMKFGYNLTLLKEKHKITIIEPIKMIACNMEYIYEPTKNCIINDVFIIIKNECEKMMQSNESVLIIMDDLNHIFNFGVNLREAMYYVRYLRSLIEHYNTVQLCIVTHIYKDELKNSFSNIFAQTLKYIAHLFIKIEPLKTGYSSDISGNLIINWRIDNIRIKYNWPQISKYIYKLSDRQVQIYIPGTSIPLLR
ncbi:uncharacterized protein LOC122714602 [Apis laboriosa]|uniref:uncharacterized protein LOC122714602 n=1 Tax=Apis laboriosa TaxID=183418 RepID=UPI001CC42CA0|nr:uncharacterized protein LOC122714602 [Apis laboriosa]